MFINKPRIDGKSPCPLVITLCQVVRGHGMFYVRQLHWSFPKATAYLGVLVHFSIDISNTRKKYSFNCVINTSLRVIDNDVHLFGVENWIVLNGKSDTRISLRYLTFDISQRNLAS